MSGTIRRYRNFSFAALSLLLVDSAHAQQPAAPATRESAGPATQPAAAVGASRPTTDENRRRAKELFDRAETEYRLGQFAEALQDYHSALELRHHPSIIFNIAQCHRQLGQFEKAVFYYRLFLSDWERQRAGSRPPNQGEVEAHIARLTEELRKRAALDQQKKMEAERERVIQLPETRKGSLRIEGLSALGAQVLVNGVLRGISPMLEPIAAEVGRVQLRVEAAGFLPWTDEVSVAAGAETRVHIALRPIPRKNSWWLVGTLSTLALAAGAEALAIAYYGRANEHYEDTDNFRDDRKMVVVGHALAGAFAALSATSLILYLTSGRAPAEESPRAAVLPWPGGVVTVGGFRF